jgi:hypothetical protein
MGEVHMNKRRIGEDRGSKEMDGCPLTGAWVVSLACPVSQSLSMHTHTGALVTHPKSTQGNSKYTQIQVLPVDWRIDLACNLTASVSSAAFHLPWVVLEFEARNWP